jgi:pentapeptide MXKDX repeat protein
LKTATLVMCASTALAATGALAQDTMKKDAMPKDGMAQPMTMQQCKDYMAMAKDGVKKDDAMMKKDAACADMMKKDGATMKDGAMKKDGMPAEPKK